MNVKIIFRAVMIKFARGIALVVSLFFIVPPHAHAKNDHPIQQVIAKKKKKKQKPVQPEQKPPQPPEPPPAPVQTAPIGLKFHTSEKTLNRMMEIISKREKGVYLRFGDGDVLLADGDDDSYQMGNASLQSEMGEAFGLNGPNILKCLPLGCKELGGLEEGMSDGVHARSYGSCIDMLTRVQPIWNAEIEDVYSMTALAHTAIMNPALCIQFLKFIKQAAPCILVGNCDIPDSVRSMLFGSECEFIPTPPQNSYSEIDRIEQECLEIAKNYQEYTIIVTSMGCSGRALQKRLWHKLDNVFLFDFGSLMDAICGWDTRAWISLTHFSPEDFHETLEKELGAF